MNNGPLSWCAILRDCALGITNEMIVFPAYGLVFPGTGTVAICGYALSSGNALWLWHCQGVVSSSDLPQTSWFTVDK